MSSHSNGSGPLRRDGTVAVVGASLAGLRAAETLRSEGFTGRLILIGEELHLPYDRPPLSKQVLAGTWPPERAMLADRIRLDELRLEQRLGHRAVGLDAAARRITLDDGSVVEADGIVLATGAVPRRLPGTDGADGVFVLRTLDDSVNLRNRVVAVGAGCRVVVVGAGFIGSEVASTCRSLDCEVTVVELLDTPLSPVLGPEVGATCAALHGANGVVLRTGVGIAAYRPPPPSGPEADSGRAGQVELSDGTRLAADIVVVGIGVTPAVGWLEDSGLTLDDGVVCDRSLFAADGIVAAGDLARWRWQHDGDDDLVRIEHWQLAAEEGVAAARSLLAGRADAEPFDPVPYFWSDQYGLRIQVLGSPRPTDEMVVVEGSLTDERFVALYGRRGRLRAALAISRPRQLMAFRAPLAEGTSFPDAVALLGAAS
jgi:3-phenylpropionate/trans-cinnamate dioxygenase ferredoxin reductase subunit